MSRAKRGAKASSPMCATPWRAFAERRPWLKQGKMMRKLYWTDLTTKEFETLDPGRTVAVLPIAAIEQHGPHLSVATDSAINQGMLGELARRPPEELSILILPIQAVGKSNEHLRAPGTLTLTAE